MYNVEIEVALDDECDCTAKQTLKTCDADCTSRKNFELLGTAFKVKLTLNGLSPNGNNEYIASCDDIESLYKYLVFYNNQDKEAAWYDLGRLSITDIDKDTVLNTYFEVIENRCSEMQDRGEYDDGAVAQIHHMVFAIRKELKRMN
jgi:hypothetical protein